MVNDPATDPPDDGANVSRFFTAVLGRSAAIVAVTANEQRDRGRANEEKWFSAGQQDAATRWVRERRTKGVTIAAHVNHKQVAAFVSLRREDAAALATFAIPPTGAVQSPDALEAVWLLNPHERWVAGSNLSHALARRLGGRPATRCTVPHTNPWRHGAPVEWVESSGCVYDPEDLRERLKQIRSGKK